MSALIINGVRFQVPGMVASLFESLSRERDEWHEFGRDVENACYDGRAPLELGIEARRLLEKVGE